VVVWAADGDQDGTGLGVFMRLFDDAGVPTTPELLVTSDTWLDQGHPAVDAWADGEFVVAWGGQDDSGVNWDIYARRFDPVGSPIGDSVLVNIPPYPYQEVPSVATFDDGYIVTWSCGLLDTAASYTDVFAQRFDRQDQRLYR
jgi:hypothetical protein